MSQGSGEKTEKASPKKKRDAREKGEVHKSTELVSAFMLFILFGTLKVGYEGFIKAMEAFMNRSLSSNVAYQAANITGNTVVCMYRDMLFQVLPIIMPLFLVAFVSGILIHVLQTGPLFIPNKLKPNFKKINPIEGFKRIFSTATLVELVKSIIKVAILGYIIYRYLSAGLETYAGLMNLNVGKAFCNVLSSCFSMGVMIGLALIAFAGLDVLYQWWKYEKDLMMTKQEVKDENKQMEGDPQIKGKIRQKQRKLSAMRMMSRVQEADVVVTNPTHIAVALRYKQSEDRAPVVVAKGQDYLAQRIKKIAAEHKISIVENRPVARALYESCEVDSEIPPELYQAIADILIYVYRLQNH